MYAFILFTKNIWGQQPASYSKITACKFSFTVRGQGVCQNNYDGLGHSVENDSRQQTENDAIDDDQVVLKAFSFLLLSPLTAYSQLSG